MRKLRAAVYAWRYERKHKDADDKVGRLVRVPFPAACDKCPRRANAKRFGCGHDKRYAGRGRVTHTWDTKLRTCPRYYLEADADVARVLFEFNDYERGSLGPIGRLDATLVDCLRYVEAMNRKWADEAQEAA